MNEIKEPKEMSGDQPVSLAVSGEVKHPKKATFAEDVHDNESHKPVKKPEEQEEERKEYSNNIEAVITVVANAVGLGNVWRFPYMCYKNGGGAFFIPYFLMLVIAAMPIMGLEMSWGQFTSVGPVEQWNCYPLLGGVGISGFLTTFLIIIYYSVLTAYALFYLFMSLYSLKDINNPIWNDCSHSWNTETCKTIADLEKISKANVSLAKSSYSMPSGDFWFNFVSMDEGSIRDYGYPHWKMLIALFVTYGIILASVYRGVRSMGKSSYFFAIYPYFCIIFLVIAGIFKDGAAEGVLVYLIPKFDKLLDLSVWADAGQQIFFSLTLCQSVVGTLASFNDFHQNPLKNTLVVVVVNCVTSFWVGFPIFAVLGHMAHKRGVKVDEVIDSGPGLAFIAYPQALSLLPGGAIWAIFFCSMLLSVGLGSCATNTESAIALIIDFFPSLRHRKRELAFRGIFILSLFLLGLPMICESGGMQLLDLDDSYCTGINSFIFGITMCVVFGYLYGMKNFEDDISLMIGQRPNGYWRITWRYLCPIFLIFMSVIWVLNKVTKHDPKPYWSTGLGWCISMSTVLVIPIYALFVMCKHPRGLSCAAYKDLIKPNERWGPARSANRVGKYRRSSFDISVPVPQPSNNFSQNITDNKSQVSSNFPQLRNNEDQV